MGEFRNPSNFLKNIKLEHELTEKNVLVLPEEEPMRSIFIKFMVAMQRKFDNGEWTKQEYIGWKKALMLVDESVLCEVPELFLQAILNEPETNKETAILVRLVNLKMRMKGDLTEQDIRAVTNGIRSHSIVEVLRDISTKGYQVAHNIVREKFKNVGLDNLEIILEQLKDKEDNPIKDRLYQDFDDYFKYLRCINGIDRMIDFSRERLIPCAVSSVSHYIKDAYYEKDHEFRVHHINQVKPYIKKINGWSKPWQDSINR